MAHLLLRKKRIITILLALAGIGITLAYITCSGSCRYLTEAMLGVDLKYLGIFYMAAVIVFALMPSSLICLLLLAFGAGGEIFLIGYQVKSGVYCPYCLGFSATIFLALAVNFERAKKAFAVLAAAAGLIFFLLFFSGSATPVYAAEMPPLSFGKGPVEVRLYTDYFCNPCRAEEPVVAALLSELLGKNAIRVLFIDTPIHRETILFAGYFLAAVHAKGDFRQALAARAALFAAAEGKIAGKEELEAFLTKKGLAFKPVDTAPVFKIFSNYLKEDRINSTPSCVIIGPKGKQTLIGNDDIPKALRELLPEKQANH